MDPEQIALLQSLQPKQQSQRSPFDVGIARAIQSARASLAQPSREQEHAAIRKGFMGFGNQLAQTHIPNRKGFWANFAAAAPAIGAGLNEYSTANAQTEQANEAEADRMMAYQAQEQARQAQEAEREWQHGRFDQQLGLQERQFEETKRQHNLLDQFRQNSLENRRTPESKYAHEEQEKIMANQELGNILNLAEQEIIKVGDKGHRNNFGRIAEKWVPGGYRLDKDQTKINTIGDVLRGKLFNAWGYRNQAEFEHVPSISANNTPETNLAIIEDLKQLLINSGDQEMSSELINPAIMPLNNDMILMQDPDTGEQESVPANLLEQARSLGLVPVQ